MPHVPVTPLKTRPAHRHAVPRLPNLGRTLNENHVVLQTLTTIIEYCKADTFAPGPNLFGIYPVLGWRPLFTWTLWVELRHDGKPSR